MSATLSGITVPVVIRDWSGAEMEVSVPYGTPHVFLRVGPVGGFLFDRTDEISNNLRTVYKQRFSGSLSVYGPSPTVIDIEPVKERGAESGERQDDNGNTRFDCFDIPKEGKSENGPVQTTSEESGQQDLELHGEASE